MTDCIGFIGIGNMGLPMARRLESAGHHVIGCDRDPKAMAALKHSAATPGDVARAADIIFLSLPTPAVVAAVTAEIAAAGGRTRIVVDLSTTGPQGAREAAGALADAGIDMVDCPVSGGVAGAVAGTLALMVGAPAPALDAVRPFLEIFGRIFHVGLEPGMGQMMKVINNLMSAAALAVSGEGLAMAVKAGLDAETVVNVLNAGSGRNSATLDKFPRQILTGTFDAGFSIGLMLKDVKLCMDQARGLGLDLPASEAVTGIWQVANDRIGPDADFTRVVEIAERAAGVKIRAKGLANVDG